MTHPKSRNPFAAALREAEQQVARERAARKANGPPTVTTLEPNARPISSFPPY